MPATYVKAKPYHSSLEHILDELSVVDLLLVSEVQRVRHRNVAQGADFQGLFISEQEIASILSGMPILGDHDGGEVEHLAEIVGRRRQEVAARAALGLDSGVPLRLERLRALLGLCDFEALVLLLCLAPELDLKYETIYAYIQDDINKRRPTVDLALNIATPLLSERVKLRGLLAPSASLLACGLVYPLEDGYARATSFLGTCLSADQRVVAYLLDSTALDQRLLACARLLQAPVPWDEVVLPGEDKEALVTLARTLGDAAAGRRSTVLQLVGEAGVGKKTVARALCSALGFGVLVLDCAAMLASDVPPEKLMAVAFREALLQEAVPYFEGFHLLLEDGARQRALLAALAQGAGQRRGLTVLGSRLPWRPGQERDAFALLTATLPVPQYRERLRLWELHLGDLRGNLSDQDIALLAARFRLTGGQVKQVVATARDMARLRPDTCGPTVEDINAAARWHSNQGLSHLARRIHPSYSWDDIVLPGDQKAQLREICGYFSNMALVYEEWGFQSKTSLGKGLNVLFAGPSGTGKTMAADVMAGELGLDLYKIDLSSIVSKYIGETEKNLDRIFQEAQDSNAILFFDEADSLFGKRSEVRDSHDRYANIEISYLLQKMEEYQGIVVLATNLRKNLDDAFVRRMHFVVEFPMPEEAHRLEIWRRVFPGGAPVAESVDLEFVARRFKLSGGNIKNIAVTSAFLAAQDGQPISMRHIMLATKREYQKLGKLLVESEFGPYFGLVKGHQG